MVGHQGFSAFKAHEFAAHTETNCVTLGPRSGLVMASGGEDKRVNVWRMGRASNIWSLTGNSTAIEAVCFDAVEDFVVSGSAGGAVKLYDLKTGRIARNFRGHKSNVTTIACSDIMRSLMATGGADTVVKLWNAQEAKECVMSFKGHAAPITVAQLSPDSALLATADADGAVKLWDLRTSRLCASFSAGSSAGSQPVAALCFSPTQLLLAAAGGDRTVTLYDVESFEVFCHTPPESSPVKALSFAASGDSLFGATASGLREWVWEDDAAVARLRRAGDVGWERVTSFRAKEDHVVAAGALGSFLNVWTVEVGSYTALGAPPPQGKLSKQQHVQKPPTPQARQQAAAAAAAVAAAVAVVAEVQQHQHGRRRSRDAASAGHAQDLGAGAADAADGGGRSAKLGPGGELQPAARPLFEVQGRRVERVSPPVAEAKEDRNDLGEIGRRNSFGENGRLDAAAAAAGDGRPRRRSISTTVGDSLNGKDVAKPAPLPPPPPAKLLPPDIDAALPGPRYHLRASLTREAELPPRAEAFSAAKALPADENAPGPADFSGRPSSPAGAVAPHARRSKAGSPPAAGEGAAEYKGRRSPCRGSRRSLDSAGAAAAGLVAEASAPLPAAEPAAGRGDAAAGAASGEGSAAIGPMSVVADPPREGSSTPRTAGRTWERPRGLSEGELIAQVLVARAELPASLALRLSHLKALRAAWAAGDVTGAIQLLRRAPSAGAGPARGTIAAAAAPAERLAAAADFLLAVRLDSRGVTLDACVALLPLLEDMLRGDGGERAAAAALLSAEALVRAFAQGVREVLRAPVPLGVDMAGEERRERCRRCHEGFARVHRLLERSAREYYDSQRVQALAASVRELLARYLR